jgi:hypothetical protein
LISPADIAATRADPFFPAAMRHLAQGLLDAYDGNRLLNRVLNDRGRVMFGLLALHLHFHADATGAGLTAARLGQLCEATAVCSRGRAKALLALMRWAGYLAPDQAASDRRKRPLVPTERMLASYRRRWRIQVEAAAMLARNRGLEVMPADEQRFVGGLAIEMGLAFRAGFRILDGVPALRPIAERDSAFFLVLAIALAGPPGAGIAPATPVKVSITSLAARFHVSRAHALYVLRTAQSGGLLVRDADNPAEVTCRPLLRSSFEDFFATTLTIVAHAARRAAEAPRA